MATRSAIAMKTPEGKIKAIYCHWDGYVDHNGKILINHYTDAEMVNNLIELGDLSTLGTVIGEKQNFDAKHGNEPELPMTDDWCLAYHRDRGENWADTSPQTMNDAVEFIDAFEGSACEYFYLFNGQDWLVSNGKKDANGFPTFDFVEVEILKEITQ
tara:strand:- start:163 stop:633 length:471 start_codon:yes stop_codon:yes gene_type:complete